MTDRRDVGAAVERRRSYATKVLRALLRASRDGEVATQRAVESLLAEIGWNTRAILRRPTTLQTRGEFVHPDEIDDRERLTIVAEYPASNVRKHKSRLLLWAHPDGMPFDGAPGWRNDPFAGTIEDGRMYGWGIADDLSGVAAMIAVAAVVSDLGTDGSGLVLASTPSKGHASGVLAALDELDGIGAGIYLHPAESGNGLADIKALAPGMIRLRLVIDGRQPETAEPNHTLYVDDAVEPIEPMMRLLAALHEYNAQRARHANAGSPATMMVGTLSAGESVSRVPPTCEAVITFSMPPGEDLASTCREIARTIKRVSSDDSWLVERPPRIDWLFGTTGVETRADHPLYVAIAGAVERVTGQVPTYYGGHIASEIRQPILNHGIPCVGLGPRSGSLTQAGSSGDEWLDLDDFFRMIAVCAEAALGWPNSTSEQTQG